MKFKRKPLAGSWEHEQLKARRQDELFAEVAASIKYPCDLEIISNRIPPSEREAVRAKLLEHLKRSGRSIGET